MGNDLLSEKEIQLLRVSMRNLRGNTERLATSFSGSGISLQFVELLKRVRSDLEIIESLSEKLTK